jgi:hypothetical protein
MTTLQPIAATGDGDNGVIRQIIQSLSADGLLDILRKQNIKQ